jgi:hypothetical protein
VNNKTALGSIVQEKKRPAPLIIAELKTRIVPGSSLNSQPLPQTLETKEHTAE